MCAAALEQIGIARVIFGCANHRFGGTGSIYSFHNDSISSHHYPVQGGLYADKAIHLFREFYARGNPNAPEEKRARDLVVQSIT